MPYMRMDVEAYDEMVEGMSENELEMMGDTSPSGEFEYEEAKASFVHGALGPIAELTLRAIKEMGATEFM